MIRDGRSDIQTALSQNLFSTRVEITAGNRVIDTREVYAGQGYLSQSSDVIYVRPPPDTRTITLRVRWPDGTEQTRTVRVLDSRQVTLSKP